jgi:hypothetical protein
METLVNEDLREPQQSLRNIIALFKYHGELFSNKLPGLADIGLI